MACAVGIDEGDGLLAVPDSPYRQDVVVVLRVPVLLRRGEGPSAQDAQGLSVCPQLHVMPVKQGQGLCPEGFGDVLLHQHALHGVAHGGAGALGIVEDLRGHVQVRLAVHIDMADPLAGADDGGAGLLRHCPDQAGPAPGDQHVHIAVQVHQLICALPAGVLDQADTVRGQPHGHKGLPHEGRCAAV